MELTPLDIRNQAFRTKRFGGVDAAEVKAFLDSVAVAFEQQGRLRTDLTERLKIAEERVNYYKQIEKTMHDAAMTMQRMLDEAKHNAEKEAEIIIAEAKARAVREVEMTKREAETLRGEIEQLRQLRTNYFIRARALLVSQSDLLLAMERDQKDDPLFVKPVHSQAPRYQQPASSVAPQVPPQPAPRPMQQSPLSPVPPAGPVIA